MITSFLARLALALPLVLLGIVATLLLLKRLRLHEGGRPGLAALLERLRKRHPGVARERKLKVHEVEVVGPTARLAVAQFGGRTYLLGISPAGIELLASEETAETARHKTDLRADLRAEPRAELRPAA